MVAVQQQRARRQRAAGRAGTAHVRPLLSKAVYERPPAGLLRNTYAPAGREVLHGPVVRTTTRLAAGKS